MEKYNKVLIIAIIVMSILCVCCGIYLSKVKERTIRFDNTKKNQVDKVIDKNEEDNNDEIENKTDEAVCNKDALMFKSEKVISIDNSKLISKLDYSNYTKFYCYEDICSNKESNLLSHYKELNEDSKKASNFSDFVVEIKNGKVIISGEDMEDLTLDVKNPISVRAHFDVSDKQKVFILDKNNVLYYYDLSENKLNELYKNVKNFTVFEGNDYIGSIEPSEGQNIVIAFHTKDGTLMFGHYETKQFMNIKKTNYTLIHSDDYEFPDIYLSQSKDYTYEKDGEKEIVVKNVFVSKDKIYLYTIDDELLEIKIGDDYCNVKYDKHNDSKVKSLKYNTSKKQVTIKYSNGKSETISYLKRANM